MNNQEKTNKIKDLDTKKAQLQTDLEEIELLEKELYGKSYRINDKRSIGESLASSIKQFEFLFENINKGFALHEMIFDKKSKKIIGYKFIKVNSKYEELFNIKKKELIGEIFTKKNIFKDCADWIVNYQKVVETKIPKTFIHHFENQNKYYEVTAYSPQDKQLAIIVEDISLRIYHTNKIERQKAYLEEKNKALIVSKNKAEESERLKSSFLANMSHEIRTPMNGVIGFSKLMRNPNLTKEKREKYVDIIVNSGNRLLRVVDDVLNISKMESESFFIKTSNVAINTIINDVFESFKSNNKVVAEQLSYILNNEVEQDNYNVEIDADRLTQVLNNLLSNAFKFTESGKIELGCYLHESGLKFYVNDTGIGIPKNKQEKIFDPFWQVEGDYTKKYGGTGLGLSISKKIAELMGGVLELESAEKIGSSFQLYLPLTISSE